MMRRFAYGTFLSIFQFQIKAPSSLARLRLLNILIVCLRRLIPCRLDGISDLKLELDHLSRFVGVAIAALWLACATAGCSRSPRVTFYTLEPAAQVESPVAATAVPSVAVGPVTLPELVDRPQLVVRVAANRVDILESHRWAEPLKSEIPRLIAENLGRLLPSDRVSSNLQHAGANADYRVLLDFRRFESSPGEAVTVEAVWSLRRGTGGAALKTGRSVVREPVAAAGYDPLVAAYSRALLAVSRDLAAAIRAETAKGH